MLPWLPKTRLEWMFFAATAAQGTVNSTIQIIVLVVYLDWITPVIYEVPLAYMISLILSINTLGCLYQTILTLDAFRIKNHIQIFALCITNVCLSASTILQYVEVRESQAHAAKGYNANMKPFTKPDFHFWQRVSPGLMVCTIVSSLCSVFICGIAPKLYREFSWALYQDVSPDVRVQRKYMIYQIYLVFLKYTPYFIFAFIMFYAFIDVHYAQPEFTLTLCIIPGVLLHLALAVYFIRNEKRIPMFIVLLVHVATIAYLISRLMALYGNTLSAKTAMKDEMVFYLIPGLISSVLALGVGTRCTLNFGKGLKPILLGQVQRQPRAHELEDDYYIQRLNYNILPQPTRESQRFVLD